MDVFFVSNDPVSEGFVGVVLTPEEPEPDAVANVLFSDKDPRPGLLIAEKREADQSLRSSWCKDSRGALGIVFETGELGGEAVKFLGDWLIARLKRGGAEEALETSCTPFSPLKRTSGVTVSSECLSIARSEPIERASLLLGPACRCADFSSLYIPLTVLERSNGPYAGGGDGGSPLTTLKVAVPARLGGVLGDLSPCLISN